MIRLGLIFLSLAMPATAHTGHIGELAGHDHVSAGILIGIAIAIGVLGALGKSDEDESQEEEAGA